MLRRLLVVPLATGLLVSALSAVSVGAPPTEAPRTAAPAPLREVPGGVLLPAHDAGARAQRCALGSQGVVGFTLQPVTPGAHFVLRATDATARAQDLDVVFLRTLTPCAQDEAPASPGHGNALGDEAGIVPPDAAVGIVFLFEGGNARFTYKEFPAEGPPLSSLQIVNTMHFRAVPAEEIVSTWWDLYEPHMAVAGTGAIYVTGHASFGDVQRSPAYVTTDDGETWRPLPDPEPLPPQTARVPGMGGRIGQGTEGGIAADDTGRAWLYDSWGGVGGQLFGWCDNGARACRFEPNAFPQSAFVTQACPERVRTLDKPWARYGHGRVLVSNIGLSTGLVDEFHSVSMVGLFDVATGGIEWNTCLGVGGMRGVPALRDSDGTFAVPQVLRTPEGLGNMVVHTGTEVGSIVTSPPILRVQKSWQLCQTFNGYGSFSRAGTLHLFSALSPTTVAISVSKDLQNFKTVAFDAGGLIQYMWVEGSHGGEGALVSWAVADGCDDFEPVTFYAAHVSLDAQGRPVVSDASVVAAGVVGACGHYMGNDVGPDGRAYLVVHASVGRCLGPVPEAVPFTHAPWTLYVQDAGPRL